MTTGLARIIHTRAKRMTFLFVYFVLHARTFRACVHFWDGDVVISRLGSFIDIQASKKSRSWVSLKSNNSDTSKIHFVVVFVDMAGDLGVMVEHRNSPFVFRNPSFQWSFSLTVLYKTALGATDFVLCARLWPVNLFLGFRSRKQTVHSSQWFEGDFDLLLPQDSTNPFKMPRT